MYIRPFRSYTISQGVNVNAKYAGLKGSVSGIYRRGYIGNEEAKRHHAHAPSGGHPSITVPRAPKVHGRQQRSDSGLESAF